jgi:hypothetical protein
LESVFFFASGSLFFFFLITKPAYSYKETFATKTSYLEDTYTKEFEVYPSLEEALKIPERAEAVSISANSPLLGRFSELQNLKIIYLDNTFTYDSYYLQKSGVESFLKFSESCLNWNM